MSVPFSPVTRRSILAAGGVGLIAAPAIVRAQTILDVMNGPAPWWVLRGTVPASLDFDFANGRYYQAGVAFGLGPSQLLNVSRASTETNLLPTSPAGYAYTTFGNNVAAITSGIGLQVFQSATNLSAHPTAPQNETISIPTTGSYTLWVNGTGAATVSAGTASGSGFGAASQGSPITFTIGSTGTVNIAVTGSLMALQLEQGTFGTPFIPQPGGMRAADVVSVTNITGITFSSLTCVVTFILLASNTVFNQQIINLKDSGLTNRLSHFYQDASFGVNSIFWNSVISGSVNLGSAVINVPYRSALNARGGLLNGSINGGPVVSSAAVIPTGINTIVLGNRGDGTRFLNGILRDFSVFGNAQPDAVLQNLSRL